MNTDNDDPLNNTVFLNVEMTMMRRRVVMSALY